MSTSFFKCFEEIDNCLFVCTNCKGDSIKTINNKLTKIFSLFNIHVKRAKINEKNSEINKNISL